MSIISRLTTAAASGNAGASGAFSLKFYEPIGDRAWTAAYVTLDTAASTMYFSGTTTINTSYGTAGYLASFSSDGASANWQKLLDTTTSSSTNDRLSALVKNSNGLFVGGSTSSRTGTATQDVACLFVNPSNGNLYQHVLIQQPSSGGLPFSVKAVGTDVYTYYQSNEGYIGSGDIIVEKYSTSSGSFSNVYRYALGNALNDEQGGMDVDSSGNVYATINRLQLSPDVSRYQSIVKFNGSSIVWQKELSSGDTISNLDYGNDCALDASNNIIVVGRTNNIGLIGKYNSSGTLQWQRTITDSEGYFRCHSVSCDASNNIYISSDSANGYAVKVLMLNSSGVLQWAYKIADTGATAYINTPTGDSTFLDQTNGLIYVPVLYGLTSANAAIVVCLPTDGSFSGPLGDVTVSDAVSTLTVSTSSLTVQTPSFSSTSISPTTSTTALNYNTTTAISTTLST